MSLGRQIARAKRKEQRKFNRQMEAYQEAARKAAVGAAKGGFLGRMFGTAVPTLLQIFAKGSMLANPLLGAAIAGGATGLGQWWGGKEGAEEADLERDKMLAHKGFYGQQVTGKAKEFGDKTDDLRSSSIQSGLTTAAQTAATLAATKYLKAVRQGVQQGYLTPAEALNPGNVASASQSMAVDQAATIQGISGPELAELNPSQATLASAKAYGADSSLYDQYLKDLAVGGK